MRIPPGMTESIASIRRNLTTIDEMIMRSTRVAREAREALRRADDLLGRDPLAPSSKRRERPSD
jgi:hypothetical protein